MPPFFQKTNKLGVQKNILFVQGIAVTVLSLLFVVMPSVQSFYQILSQLTVILYLIMYLLMFSGAIALRYKMKKLNRPFRIGKSGNGLMWFIGGLGFCGSLLAFILSFIPPSQISTGSNTVWFSVLIIGALIVVVAPFIIYASKKPSWVDPNSNFEPFHWKFSLRLLLSVLLPTVQMPLVRLLLRHRLQVRSVPLLPDQQVPQLPVRQAQALQPPVLLRQAIQLLPVEIPQQATDRQIPELKMRVHLNLKS